ncbi:MAG: ABC transporter ATP-binding protein [Thermoplasmatota archaeon]
MTKAIVEVDTVSKFYGKVMGLNEFSVTIGKGMTGLLGPNGAGKSTLLKIITGQIKPSKGAVRVFGKGVWNNPGTNRLIGYCPEQDVLFKNMTGLQFVSFSAKLNGHSPSNADNLAREAVRKVDLTKDMNRSVMGYSKGMRQRIKLAQAMVCDPDLLILDEPLAGTDPIGRVKIMDLLDDIKKDGKEIIVSSHVLHEVERMTESIILVNKGRLVAQGNIHDIRESMDRFPLTVRIRSRERNVIGKMAMDIPGVKSISFGDDPEELLVRTGHPPTFFSRFQEMVIEKGLALSSIDSPDDNLDAIFRYLVT